ncbi:MAG: hypothetical protein WBD20_23070 [Pirellulaceae bacterium]
MSFADRMELIASITPRDLDVRSLSNTSAPLKPVATRRHIARMIRCAVWGGWMLMFLAGLPTSLLAQSLGDFPSTSSIRAAATAKTDAADGLPIGAFMVLDKSGNLVYIPGMTYERWRELESGTDSNDQAFVFEPLEIKGDADDGRAQFDITLEVTVEPTDGQYVSIPLKMANFFLLRAPEFTSSPAPGNNDSQFVQPGKDGMLLKIRSDRRRKLKVRMNVSALVRTGPNRIDFQLPSFPANIHLTTGMADAIGEVIGSGSEVFQSDKTKDGRTKFDVATGGGSLTLQWSPANSDTASETLLESDCNVLLNWGSPQDQPIATVTLGLRSMRDLRGPIESFEVDLPPGAVMLDTPVLDTQDRPVTQSPVPGKPNRILVSIPEQERSQRVAVRFELQLANDDASEKKPLALVVPRVVGALRQQGEIQIQTGNDYRLRWRSSPWVRSFFSESTADAQSVRKYQFRFDRGQFSLPIWLSANKRQLLVNSESTVTIRDSLASLEMEIQFSGRATDSRSLQLDLADWRLSRVIDADTDDTLPWFESDQILSIEMNTNVDELPPIKIFAQRNLDEESPGSDIRFQLPRVRQVDQSFSIGANNVAFQSTGRSSLVVNLNQSNGLERVPLAPEETPAKITTSRFRVVATEEPPRVVGAMVSQPPQIILASNADVVLSGDQLTTTVDWAVNPQMDLAGSMPVRVPLVALIEKPAAQPTRGTDDGNDNALLDAGDIPFTVGDEIDAVVLKPNDEIDTDMIEVRSLWSVTVDNAAAQLVSIGGDRFELVSDRLGTEPVVVRWRHQDLLETTLLNDEIYSIQLPAPAITDVTVRGDIVVTMQGDSVTNLFAADTASKRQIEFQSVPDRVRVRLAKQTKDQNDLSIRKAVLRTAVGVETRHEQLLALIQGGDSLDLGLPAGLGDIEYEAFVDRKGTQVSRDGNRLRLSLPGDSETHRVDLRIWVSEPAGGLLVTITPLLQLPLRAGRIYWQVITPRDSHVVWAAPSIGRAMNWQFDDWRLTRESIYSDATLSQWVGVDGVAAMPPGNRYLYIGSDVHSFSTRTLSRSTLWFLVGGLVLAMAWTLNYVPASRSPLTAVVGAILFAGLVALAPDAAVLAGQVSMIALVLVIVMVAIASLVRRPADDRIITNKSMVQPKGPSAHSTHTFKVPQEPRGESETATAAPPPSGVSS